MRDPKFSYRCLRILLLFWLEADPYIGFSEVHEMFTHIRIGIFLIAEELSAFQGRT
jgi:hypothetical protein